MTARDWWWCLAVILWVGGWLTICAVWLHARRRRALDHLGRALADAYPMTLDDAAAAVASARRGFRIIPRPPYDWRRDGE